MRRWLRILRLRWRIGDLEAALEYHRDVVSMHSRYCQDCVLALRADRSELGRLEGCARADRMARL